MKSHEKIFALIASAVFVFGMIVPMTTPVTQLQSQTRTTNGLSNSSPKSTIPQANSVTSGLTSSVTNELHSYVVTSTSVSYGWGSSTSGNYIDTWSQNGVYQVSTSESMAYNGVHDGVPFSGTDWNQGGYYAWSYPDRIWLQDGSSASTYSLGGTGYSHYLRGSDFRLCIPSNAVIDGIYFKDYRKNGGYFTVYDNAIYLVKNVGGSATVVGTNHASATAWTNSYAWFGYGSSSDLWGTTWTYSDINDANFGVVLQAKCVGGNPYYPPLPYVDNFVITVYFHTIAGWRLSYYYNFQFVAAPRANVAELDWNFYGHGSAGNIGIYLYNWVTSTWDNTGLTVPSGSDASRGQTSVDIDNYMDASGKMRISFYSDGQVSNSVDYLYWSVTIQAPTIDIRNIPAGDSLYSNVLIIAKVTGFRASVVYQIDTGPQYAMSRVGSTDNYQATWDTSSYAGTTQTLYVKARDLSGNTIGTYSVSVNVLTTYKYELYIEIDYITGHTPTQAVLNYMQNYWKGHAISVTFQIDDAVADPTPGDGMITESDGAILEANYNDVWMYDDRWFYGTEPDPLVLKEKWMLYGTADYESGVMGRIYVWEYSGSDLLAGNYMFIADTSIDNWEAQNGISNDGGEIVVVCHEVGHTIGMSPYPEVYDPDLYSVMSQLWTQNAKDMGGCWYCSREYWSMANLDYYLI